MDVTKKKTKKFKKFTKPRYLVGQVPKPILDNDLKIYNGHRHRVFLAQSTVDCKPPKFVASVYFNPTKILSDAKRLKQIDDQNRALLKRLSTIARSRGSLDTHSTALCSNRIVNKWELIFKELKKIEALNKAFYYKNLMKAKSQYTRKEHKLFWKKALFKIKAMVKMPLVILKKPNPDELLNKAPSICSIIEKAPKIKRPMAFLQFQELNGPILGSIEIELYSDICPVTVENFMALVSGENKYDLSYKNSIVHRIIRGSHCEAGDITKGNGRGGMSIFGETFSEEKHVLKHSRAGVISMIRIDGVQENDSKFCITFCEKPTFDKKNVVFGKIVKGMGVLDKLQIYGSRYGKPLVPIIISNCRAEKGYELETVKEPESQIKTIDIKKILNLADIEVDGEKLKEEDLSKIADLVSEELQKKYNIKVV